MIGNSEWDRRLAEVEEGGALTVLGLYQGEREMDRGKVISATKEYLVRAWGRRDRLGQW